MTLEDAINLRKLLDTKQRSRVCNKLRVMDNIVKGLYDEHDNPLEIAQDDLDILNGDKIL